MRYVEVGGLRTSVIGLGTWQFGTTREWGWGGDYGDEDARAVLERALELGINLIDTAESYGKGESERIVGRFLAQPGARDRVVLATKVFPSWPNAQRVQAAAAGSLSRLGTDHIDLYQVHWPNPLVPHEETMAGMRALVDRGVIRHVGVSNYSLARWRQAEDALGRPILSDQVRLNLLQRKPTWDLIPFAASTDRLILGYSPLAQGVLTGKYGPGDVPQGVRARNILFSEENLRRAEPVIAALRAVAEAHGASASQVALAWVASHPNTVAIAGAKNVKQLESNAAAGDLTLTQDQLARLNEAARQFHPERPGSAATLAWRQVSKAVDTARERLRG
jgi:aryl-alcohol dehydrogenase-like predicted oxidoreductase